MEIEWSNGVVEVIKIVLGCFFAMRLLSKQIKSVRTIGKFGKFLLWTIVYGIILFFAKRLFYDPVKQLLFVTVTCELVLFIANCGRTVFVILAVVAIAITFIVILGRKMGDTPVAFFNMLAAISLFLLDFGVWKAVSVFQKAKREKEELAAQNQAAKLQIKSQKEVSAVYEQMRALKHDMKSHLYTVSGLLDMGEYKKAQEYIGQIEEKRAEGYFVKTKHPIIDALLAGKGALARKEKIRVEVSAALKAELLIRDSDLIIILGNLYDNAVEACMKIVLTNENVENDLNISTDNNAATKKNNRWIYIKLVSTQNDFIIVFENPVAQTQTMAGQQSKRNVWKSTKTDGELHGYGMKNIDKTVKAYGGYCSRTIENGIFSCHIRMQNRADIEPFVPLGERK